MPHAIFNCFVAVIQRQSFMNGRNVFISAFHKLRGVDSCLLKLTLELLLEDNWKVSILY